MVPEGISPTSVTESVPGYSPAKSSASSPGRGAAPAPPARKIQATAVSPAAKEQPEEPDTQPRRKLSDNPFIRRDSEEGKPFDRTYQTPAQIRKAEAAKRAEAEKAAAEAEKQRLADSHYHPFLIIDPTLSHRSLTLTLPTDH